MTSDSITEQAARALNHAGWTCDGGNDEPDQYDECADCRRVCLQMARALADAGLLAHQAPATEDEAAEVEQYLVHRSHLVRPAGTDGIESWLSRGWVWVTGAPWREVSR